MDAQMLSTRKLQRDALSSSFRRGDSGNEVSNESKSKAKFASAPIPENDFSRNFVLEGND